MADEGEKPPVFDMNRFLAGMLAQNAGDKDATIRQLGSENFSIRKKYQVLRKKHEELEKVAQLDKDAVVLSGDEAKDHLALKEMKLTAAQVKATVEERDKLKTDLTGLAREKDVTRSATAYEDVKYKPAILLDQLNSRQMDLAFRKVKIKDEAGNEAEVELPHVRKQGDDKGSWSELKGYVEKELKEYLPALVATEGSPTGSEDRRFTPVPGSGPAAPAKARGSRDLVGDHIASRYALPGEQVKRPGQPTPATPGA